MSADYTDKPENTGVIDSRNPDGTPEGAADYVDTAQTKEVHPRKQPPYADRNLAALKIGSRSPRVYGRVAEGIADALLESEPSLAEYPEELAALASTEAIVALIRLELAARGISKNGEVRFALLDRYFSAERAAAKRRDAIGLSPIGEAVIARERASAAALKTSAAVDLVALAARGREAREQRGDIVVTVLEDEKKKYAIERETATADWRKNNSTDEEGNI